MLIKKPLDSGDIITIKLSNGDEVVAKLLSQDTAGCTVSKPVLVSIQPSGPSEVAISFMPFMVSSQDETPVVLGFAGMLLKPVRTRADVANNYRRATSSLDIATPAETERLRQP